MPSASTALVAADTTGSMFTKTWRKSSNKKTITQKKHSNHSRQRVYTGTDRQISSPKVNTRVNIGKVQAVSKEGILLSACF